MAGPLLDVRNLSVSFPSDDGPVVILDDVSFALDRGESVSFVGESGCGKSMTALAVMALLPDGAQTSGQVLFDGQDLLTMPEEKLCRIRGRRIAMVFQEPMTALNPVHSIGRQIGETISLHLGLNRTDAEKRTRRLLERVGLPAPRFSPDLYPYQLSGGQRQRVVIAMALACDPDILIADEPTTALDVTIQAQILDLIADVTAETGMALMMITHDLGVVAETTDRVHVMYSGRIVEHGTTEAVFGRMAHPYTRGLFKASPHAAADLPGRGRRRLPAIPGQVPDPTERPGGCAFADRCDRAGPRCRVAPPKQALVAPGHYAACVDPILERGAP